MPFLYNRQGDGKGRRGEIRSSKKSPRYNGSVDFFWNHTPTLLNYLGSRHSSRKASCLVEMGIMRRRITHRVNKTTFRMVRTLNSGNRRKTALNYSTKPTSL